MIKRITEYFKIISRKYFESPAQRNMTAFIDQLPQCDDYTLNTCIEMPPFTSNSKKYIITTCQLKIKIHENI